MSDITYPRSRALILEQAHAITSIVLPPNLLRTCSYEYEEFNPYLFIKMLPSYQSVRHPAVVTSHIDESLQVRYLRCYKSHANISFCLCAPVSCRCAPAPHASACRARASRRAMTSAWCWTWTRRWVRIG